MLILLFMNKLIFATNNNNKVEEIKEITGKLFQVISLKEAGLNIDIPEPHDTLEENAREKSRTIYQLTKESCFSEDTGLEVLALNGEPGVKSARYAGEGKNAEENIQKLLRALDGIEDRKARFKTVISLIIKGNENLFSGHCEGQVTTKPRGEKGFGYDSIFIPIGETRTFAEMNAEEKNLYSHRRKATEQLLSFLFQNGMEKFH